MKYAAFLCAFLLGIGSAAAQGIGPYNGNQPGGIAPGKQSGGGGSGTVTTGTTNAIAVYPSSGTTVAPVATANSAVLATDGSGNPSLTTTLPTGLTIPAPTMTGTTTTAGITDTGGINTSVGYSFGGSTVLSVLNPTNANPVVALGPGACASMTSNANFNMCLGPGSLASYTGSSSAELIMVGPKAGAALVSPAVHDVAVGTYGMHYETTGNSDTCMGGDCMRNTIGVFSGTAIGSYSGGNYFGQLSTFLGANSMIGNGASITVSGTITTSDVISLTFTGSFTGSPVTITYTVPGGATLASITTGIATAMTASTALVNADIRQQTDGTATPNTVSVAMPGTSVIGIDTTVTNSSSGISETITITNGVTAAATRNNAVGFDAEYGSRWTSGSYNNAFGDYVLANITTGTNNECIGDKACMFGTTTVFMSVVGDEAFMNMTTGFSNTGIGYNIGQACTTCRNTTLIGVNAGKTTLTTGNDIIIISDGSACDTNTSNQFLLCGSGGTLLSIVNTNNAASLFKATGPMQVAGTTFTISGCSTTTLVGGASRGSFLSGTSGTCTPVITMGGATGIFGVTNGWACFAVDVTTPADIITQTTSNTTTATLSGTTVTGDKIVFNCEPY